MRDGLTVSRGRLLLVAAGLALRLLSLFVVADPDASAFSDMRYYADVGEKIYRGEDLDDYERYYMPLGLSYAYAGFRYLGCDPRLALPLLHIGLDVLTCMLLARLAAILVSPASATWVLGAACLYPPFIVQSGFLLTETPYMFLSVTAYYWFVRSVTARRRPATYGLLCGVFFALALLFKTNLWFSLPVVAAAAAIWKPVRCPWRFVVGALAGWLVIAGATRAPSSAPLGQNANRAIANASINLYLGRTYARYIVTSDDERSRWVHNTAPALYFKNKNDPIVVNHSPLDGWFYLRATAKYVGEHKLTLLTYTVEHVLDLFGLVPYWPLVETPMAALDRPLRVAIGLLVVLPAILALGLSWQPRDRILLVLPLATILIVSMVFFGSPRYRLPFDGYLLILATAFFLRVRSGPGAPERAAAVRKPAGGTPSENPAERRTR